MSPIDKIIFLCVIVITINTTALALYERSYQINACPAFWIRWSDGACTPPDQIEFTTPSNNSKSLDEVLNYE